MSRISDTTLRNFFTQKSSLRFSVVILVILFMSISLKSTACRFTIRDIGFSPLILEYFTLVLETDTTHNRKLVKEFTNLAYAYSIDANIRYKVFPKAGGNTVLYCYDKENRIIDRKQIHSSADVRRFMKRFLYSPVRQEMAEQMGNAFAFMLYFKNGENESVDSKIEKAIEQFRKVAPGLDKEITEGVIKLVVPRSGWQKEKIILKSLGLSPEAGESAVVILYGRARLLAEPLVGNGITRDKIFRQLVILGTDCECGMDLRPLMKKAIPFSWDGRIRQEVSDMLGFDVDNPMVLSEMAGILSKEPENIDDNLSFVPQTFDLDREFGPVSKNKNKRINGDFESETYLYPLLIMAGILVLLVAGTGIFLYLRRKR